MNPTQPLEISEVARMAAIKERQLDAEFDKHLFGQFTQLALNQSRAADAERIAILERSILELREALKLAHNKMFTWFSSEYADHPDTAKVTKALFSTPSPVGWVRRDPIDKLLSYPIEHRPSCDRGINPDMACSCGLSQAITDARRELEPKA